MSLLKSILLKIRLFLLVFWFSINIKNPFRKRKTMRRSHHTYDHIGYGFHKYGIGPYRYDPRTYAAVEWWLDYELATESEIKKYQKYLDENGWFC